MRGENEVKRRKTLCWQCQKACGKCAWSRKNAQPVNGWQVETTTVLIGKRCVQSYIVKSCPEFVPDQR